MAEKESRVRGQEEPGGAGRRGVITRVPNISSSWHLIQPKAKRKQCICRMKLQEVDVQLGQARNRNKLGFLGPGIGRFQRQVVTR